MNIKNKKYNKKLNFKNIKFLFKKNNSILKLNLILR